MTWEWKSNEANRINRAASLRTAVDHFNKFRMTLADNGEMAEIRYKGAAGQPLDETECGRFQMVCHTILWTYVMIHEQYRSMDHTTHLTGPILSVRRDPFRCIGRGQRNVVLTGATEVGGRLAWLRLPS